MNRALALLLVALLLPPVAIAQGGAEDPPGGASPTPSTLRLGDVFLSLSEPSLTHRAGATSPVEVILENRGTLDVSVRLYDDVPFEIRQENFGNSRLDLLVPPGETRRVDLALSTSIDTAPGTYLYRVVATLNGDPDVTGDLHGSLTVTGGPIPFEVSIVQEAWLSPGTTAVSEYEVTNLLDEPLTITFDNYVRGEVSASGIDVKYSEPRPLTIPPRGTGRFSYTWIAADNASLTLPQGAQVHVVVHGGSADGLRAYVPLALTWAFIPPHGDPEPRFLLLAAVLGLAAFATTAFLLLRRESARWSLLVPLLPLYTRLTKRKVLQHGTRDALLESIRNSPGINLSTLKQEHHLNWGSVIHHLRTLERHRHIVSRREGGWRRFYPVEHAVEVNVVLTPAQARVVGALAAGGSTQSEAAAALGLTQQAVSYHLKSLVKAGHVLAEIHGGEWRYRRVERASVPSTTNR